MFISFREAQQKTDEHKELLSSPRVYVQPFSDLVDKAISIVNQTNPGLLNDVTDIRVDLNKAAFGEFESSSPNTIFINLGKLESEVRAKLSGRPEEEIKKELINQISSTIIHEATHQHEFSQNGTTNEASPEKAEKEFREKINQ